MKFDELTYPDRAIGYLAGRLVDGTLVLFLGSGTSSGAGLPNWRVLVKLIRKEVGLRGKPLDDSAKTLQTAADEARQKFGGDDKGFAAVVRKCLYQGKSLEESLVYDDLLVSLGALMMGSRRGTVRRVVTLNFDSVLEYYLSLCGYVSRVVTQPPVDEGAEDVRVYHPHGFLPHPDQKSKSSDFVILGLKSVNERIGSEHDPWFEMVRHLLLSGTALFVGLSENSFRDAALAPLLANVSRQINRRRPTGFWLLPGKSAIIKTVRQEFLDYGVVPLGLETFQEVPKFLLKVCQRAANLHADRQLAI
jgi:hypothetical protein